MHALPYRALDPGHIISTDRERLRKRSRQHRATDAPSRQSIQCARLEPKRPGLSRLWRWGCHSVGSIHAIASRSPFWARRLRLRDQPQTVSGRPAWPTTNGCATGASPIGPSKTAAGWSKSSSSPPANLPSSASFEPCSTGQVAAGEASHRPPSPTIPPPVAASRTRQGLLFHGGPNHRDGRLANPPRLVCRRTDGVDRGPQTPSQTRGMSPNEWRCRVRTHAARTANGSDPLHRLR